MPSCSAVVGWSGLASMLNPSEQDTPYEEVAVIGNGAYGTVYKVGPGQRVDVPILQIFHLKQNLMEILLIVTLKLFPAGMNFFFFQVSINLSNGHFYSNRYFYLVIQNKSIQVHK